MKIEVLGDKKKPAVLLVHGMFCNADSVKHFAKYLQDEYYVIVPTMSGHYPGSADYISKEKEAEAATVAGNVTSATVATNRLYWIALTISAVVLGLFME